MSTSSRSNTAGRRTASSPTWCRSASTSPAPPVTAGRCGCGSRRSVNGPCMRCLEKGAARRSTSTPTRIHQPGRAIPTCCRRPLGEELNVAAWARDALALALAGPDQCRPDCAGLCPKSRREPQRGPRSRRAQSAGEPEQCGLSRPSRASRNSTSPCRCASGTASSLRAPRRDSLSFRAVMAVPKQKQSHARTAQRRAQHKITAPAVNDCPQCRAASPPHRVCPQLSRFYGGREVVHVHDEHDHDHEHLHRRARHRRGRRQRGRPRPGEVARGARARPGCARDPVRPGRRHRHVPSMSRWWNAPCPSPKRPTPPGPCAARPRRRSSAPSPRVDSRRGEALVSGGSTGAALAASLFGFGACAASTAPRWRS